MPAKPKTMDEYFAGLSDQNRVVLGKLRQAIKAVAPGSEECISYGLAAFRLDGHPLVAFGGWVNHCAFYPMSAATLKAHQDELERFETSKGTIRFAADKPLPAALVRKLVKARIAENAARYAKPRRRSAVGGNRQNAKDGQE
jgi:uncharacterized protein YdhG (YjbR/CyaY superfamily)